MSLAHNASSSSLSLRTLHGNEAKQAALLCVIAFIQRQANSLSQHRVTPVEVGVQINNCSANDRKRLEDYFGCSVDTESPQGWFIRYSYHDVMEPYAAQNAMLREANEQIVRQYLNRVRQYSFTVRVEEEIEEELAETVIEETPVQETIIEETIVEEPITEEPAVQPEKKEEQE